MGSSKKPKQTVTLYYMSEHFGICHGPLDFISEIIINEKSAWAGQRTAQGDIVINKQDLFGGVKKEGGVAGTVHFLPGGPTQTIPEDISAKHGKTTATMPAYRGIASAFFHKGRNQPGFYWSANSPYLPPVWIKASRASQGLNQSYARLWRGDAAEAAIYLALDLSGSMDIVDSGAGMSRLAGAKAAIVAMLEELRDGGAVGTLDWRIVGWSTFQQNAMERRNATAANYNELIAHVNGFSASGGTDFNNAVSGASTFFNASGAKQRIFVFITDGEPTPVESADQAAATLFAIPNVTAYAFNINLSNITYTAKLDNTPADGVPVVAGGDPSALQAAMAFALGREFDSNPAHIIYECLTNTDWGMGAPATAIDVPAFESAAVTLHGEGFGLSMIWTQQSTIESFISEVLDHIEAVLFVNPMNGLLTLKLIRDDYSIPALPVFTPDNAIVSKFGRKLWGETINEIVVTFTNPKNEAEETVIAQDLANIEAQGGIVSDGRNYYGVRVRSLATKLAHRDLRAASTPLASCDIEVNRAAWNLLPGQCVVLHSPDDGIDSMVMRVGPVDYGKPGDATVRASLVEDIFSLPLADYELPPDTEWEPVSDEPTPADHTLAFTLPYYLVVNEVDQTVLNAGWAYPETFAGVLAAEAGQDTPEFELYEADGDELGTKTIVSRATLAANIPAEPQTVLPAFPGRTQGNEPTVGGLMLIEGASDATSELCLITAGDSTAGYTVKRGVLDTIPRAWPAGTPVWFLDANLENTDDTARSEAEAVQYKVLPRTSLGVLDIAAAPIISHTLSARPHLPSRPANVKIGGNPGFTGPVDQQGVDPIPVTWANRNRLTEDAVVLPWDAADVTPEAGQTTRIEIRNVVDGSILTTHDDLPDANFNLPAASFAGKSRGRVRVGAKRDGLISLQAHEIEVIVAAGYGYGYGYNYGGA